MKQKFTLVFFLITLSFLKFNRVKAQVNVQDSLALVDLYDSTNGAHWWKRDGWTGKSPVSTWYGITVTANRVTDLNLHVNGLTGTIPSSIGNLTSLKNLDFYDNQLTGSIPASMGNLINLESLDLEFNNLSGDISTLNSLIKLYYLDLNDCHLTGNISFLAKLPNPQGIYLAGNQLSGQIPVINCANIAVLDLSFNQLSGPIPVFKTDTANFYGEYGVTIRLEHNNLNGNINKFDSIVHLAELVLNNNQLTGRIPASLNKLIDLNVLDLSGNQLTGTIPSLDSLKNLGDLALSNNQLTGKIPSSLNNYNTKLYALDISNNNLSGTIPSLSNLKLTNIDLSYNQFTGKLPSLENSNPSYAYFSHNELSGKIPASYNNFDLVELDLSDNNLDGAIPSFLGSHYNLDVLNLQNNQFTFAGMENIVTTFPFTTYSPQANITIIQNGNLLSVSAGGTLSNNTYKWYKNGVLFKTKTGNAKLTVRGNGNYSVNVTNSIATSLTLYSDTVNYIMSPSSSIAQAHNENKILKAQVYPNPAATNATVSFYTDGRYSLTITNVSGKILQAKTGIALKGMNTIQLDVSKYPAGIYFITISDAQTKIQTLRLNKE